MAAPLTPSAIGWLELWSRLFGLVRDWWWQLSITFLCGIGHVAAIIGIGVVSALIVGKVAKGQEFTDAHHPDGIDSVVVGPALSGILARPRSGLPFTRRAARACLSAPGSARPGLSLPPAFG